MAAVHRDVRLYDPRRTPPNWDGLLRPGQVAVFALDQRTGIPCDITGLPFQAPEHATCVIVDDVAEARRLCEAQLAAHPDVTFEIYDDTGRARPPLLTVAKEQRKGGWRGARGARPRKPVAALLVLGAAGLFWIDYRRDGLLVVPTIMGLNMLLGAFRLVLVDIAAREADRTAQERMARYAHGSQQGNPGER